MREREEFVAIHAGSWHIFNKVAQHKQLTLEEAEEKMKNRKKTADGYERWMMKAANNGPAAFGEVGRFEDKESNVGGGRGRKKTGDDDEGHVSDRGEEAEEEEAARKNRLGLNKRASGDDDDDGPKGGDHDLDDDDIEKALCHGNVSKQQHRSPSVIVIGGGMAGLAAARALGDASFQVILLESRDRLGGRIHTDYSFGFPVDLGASWLYGVCEENPLAPVIGRLGLPLYRTSGDNSVLYDHDLESYALFDMDGNQVPQELVTKVGKTFEIILQETEKVREELNEDISIQRALSIVFDRMPELRLEGLGHKELQWYLCRMEGWFATDADPISLKGWEQEVLLPGGHGLMVRGYLPVINTLGKGLDICLGHRVTSVVRGYNGVKVTVEDGRTFDADAAIVAVPLGVLKAKMIKFEPTPPDWKEAAIAELGVGLENKIILHWTKVFWPNVEFVGVVADTSYGCNYFLNLHKDAGHPVLVYMPSGKLAKDIDKMSDEAAANFAFTQLKWILPDALPPIQYLVSHWGKDINSLGSYSYDAVGKPHELYERLRIPIDNLFFAGEATSINYPGSVQGAYNTGLMAAEDCRMCILECYGELDLFQSFMGEEGSVSVPLLISRM